MSATVSVRNESARKRVYRRQDFASLAVRICEEEQPESPCEVSVLLCDDDAMQTLNREYRGVDAPTDVLSFEQDGHPPAGYPRLLGDIVISLETVENHCQGDRDTMREELRLLFCHGLLHLLGYDHGTPGEKREMTAKQAHYLGLTEEAAWQFGARVPGASGDGATASEVS